jgi:hypothetical protein
MKKLIAILFIIIFIASQAALAAENPVLDLPVKRLYSAQSEDSNVIYDIPIEVKLLDISEDGNWYKVKISFNLGPLCYKYVGWSHIPVAEIMAEREKEAKKVATLPSDK